MNDEQRSLTAILHLYEAVTTVANDAEDVADALHAGIAAVCDAVGWPVGHAFVVSDGRLEATNIWCLHDPERFASFRAATEATSLPLVDSAPGPLRRTALSGQPAWIVDVAEEERFQRAQVAATVGLRGALTFPVLVGNDVAAVLEFFSTEPAAPDIPLLDVMLHVGIQLGRVFERQRVRDGERRTLEAERRYLRIAAHELRGPLTALNTTIALLADRDGLAEKDIDLLVASAGHGVRRLGSIATNFLVEARLHAGAIRAQRTTCDVEELVRATLRDFPDLADHTRLSCPGGVAIVADPFLLQQVLSNLLSNAKKYGQPPVLIDVSTRDTRVRVSVTDHGSGVPEEFVPRLFERYSRLTEGGVGAGVGLEIVRGLTELQDGTIEYEAAAGAGARFVLDLPAAPEA